MFCSSEVVVDVVDVVAVELKCLFATTLRREREIIVAVLEVAGHAHYKERHKGMPLHTHARTHTHTRTYVYTHEPSFLPPSVCECVWKIWKRERDGRTPIRKGPHLRRRFFTISFGGNTFFKVWLIFNSLSW